MIVFLLAPAIANGFPLIFADTGGYLLRPFAHTLELGRSAIYGAFLAAGMQFYFWPNIVLQAILSAWIVVLVLRVNGLRRARWALAVIAALSMLTSLPWYVDLLMPDVFVPLSVLAFYLLTFRRDGLSRFERIGLGAVCAFVVAREAMRVTPAWAQSFVAVVRNKSRCEDSIQGLAGFVLPPVRAGGVAARLVAYRRGRFRLASLVFEW